jgi:hypothetical protein
MKFIFDYFARFKIEPSATLAILLSVLTFSLGFLFNWISREIGRHRDKNAYRRSIKFTLLNFARSCGQQSDQVRKSLAEASLLDNKNFYITTIPISSLEYLASLDHYAFVKNFRPKWWYKKSRANRYSEMVAKLLDLIARVKGQQDGITKITNLMFSSYGKHEAIYHESLENLKLTIIEITAATALSESNQFDTRRQIVVEYNSVFVNWQKNGTKSGFRPTYLEIVQELMKLNSKYPYTDFALKTIRLLDLSVTAYINVEKVDQYLKEKFDEFSFFHRKVSRVVTLLARNL